MTGRTSSADHDDEPETPAVDVSAALGEAGHETEDLGFGEVADTGPVLHHAEDGDPEDLDDEILRHIASRGVDGVT